MYNPSIGSHDADGPNDQMTDPNVEQSLESVEPVSLMRRPGTADYRTELYTRLRNIIDNATESIRTLKEENVTLAGQNAELAERIGMLEYRIRAVTADLANDEMALRRSAEVLEQVLRSTPVSPARTREAAVPAEQTAQPQPPVSMVPPAEPHVMQEDEAAMAPMEPVEVPPVTEPPMDAVTYEPPAHTAEAPMDESSEHVAEAAAPEATESEEPAPAARPAGSPEGTYVLIASPFVRFSDLGQFQSSLQKLTGVHDVQVRRFAQGTLEMRLGYDGTSDLATALRGLAADIEDVQEEEQYRLRVRLRVHQDA